MLVMLCVCHTGISTKEGDFPSKSNVNILFDPILRNSILAFPLITAKRSAFLV